MLSHKLDTFASDNASSVLEILEEEGRRMVVKVDSRCEGDSAVKTETNKPRKNDHYHNINITSSTYQISSLSDQIQH